MSTTLTTYPWRNAADPPCIPFSWLFSAQHALSIILLNFLSQDGGSWLHQKTHYIPIRMLGSQPQQSLRLSFVLPDTQDLSHGPCLIKPIGSVLIRQQQFLIALPLKLSRCLAIRGTRLVEFPSQDVFSLCHSFVSFRRLSDTQHTCHSFSQRNSTVTHSNS